MWLSSQKLHLGLHDINTITNYFSDSEDNTNYLNVERFLACLQGTLNARRLAIVSSAFYSIVGSSYPPAEVPFSALLAAFNAGGMPELKRGVLASPAEAAALFASRFSDCVCSDPSSSGAVSFASFLDYYGWLSASVVADDGFVAVVCATWGVEEVDAKESHYGAAVKLLRDHATLHVKGNGGDKDPVKCLRYLQDQLGHYDIRTTGKVDVEQFLRGVKRMNCSMSREGAMLFFDRFGVDGLIDYKAMCAELYTE
jgi:hypothetical protein